MYSKDTTDMTAFLPIMGNEVERLPIMIVMTQICLSNKSTSTYVEPTYIKCNYILHRLMHWEYAGKDLLLGDFCHSLLFFT